MESKVNWYDFIGKVHNKREYKALYNTMKSINEFDSYIDKEDVIIACKKRLREFTHFDRNHFVFGVFNVDRYIVKDNGIDGFVELLYLPKECKTIEDAKDFFDEYMYLDRPHSIYDCTGTAFTSWYHIFNRNGRYCAYHCVSVDI